MINVDLAIFIGFLAINLLIGLSFSKGISNIKEYAVGYRNFSTAAITSTIVATWISADVFFIIISETYKEGLHFLVPFLGDSLVFVIIGYFFAPRMGEFLGKLSVAEAMGELYGKHARLIAALTGIVGCVGGIAVQFKVSANILQMFFGISNFYAVLASSMVVILYAAFGGIKAITFTDIIQLFTFGTIIPILSLIIWNALDNPYDVFTFVAQSNIFDYKQVFSLDHPKFLSSFAFFLFLVLPQMYPVVFQRILMARNTKQIRDAFLIAALLCFFLEFMIAWSSVLLLSVNPNLDHSNLLAYIVDNYAYTGLKGFIAIGIMAMIMSTTDSLINTSAVLFSHDLCNILGINKTAKELILSRIFAVFIGIAAITLAFTSKGLLELFMMMWSFYIATVTVPLLLAIIGFRSTTKVYLLSATAGFITVIIWKLFFRHTGIETIIPSMLANLLVFISSHYLLKQPGGWVGVKDPYPLELMRLQRRVWVQKFIADIINFNLLKFFQKNTPQQKSIYPLFGLFCIISVFSTMYTLPQAIRQEYQDLINFIYHTVLVLSTIFIIHPIWPPEFKRETFITVLWNIAVPYALIFAPTLLVIVSNFGQLQTMILMINMIVTAIILRWQLTILAICIGFFGALEYYQFYTGTEGTLEAMVSLKFKIIYLFLLFSSTLIAFVKPKQEFHEFIEEKNIHLGEQVHDREEELEKALKLKSEFLRNISHEVRSPMTGIISLGEGLLENYDKLNEKERYEAIKVIAKNSNRLMSLMNNILDLSHLSYFKSDLNLHEVNLSKLVLERVELCGKLYMQNKDIELVMDLQPNLLVTCDEYYIKKTIDNLVINAINYSNNGKIMIKLHQLGDNSTYQVQFSIQDEGIGIPENELLDIFEPFMVSSKTRTRAGGRGVGLALCKKVIDLHNGRIWAECNQECGTIFKFVLP